MNQQKPEIFETDSQDNANDIINKPQGQNQQQPYKMQSALNQVPNNQFAQMAPQFPGQINQFQFQPNFGISPGMAPGMLRMPPNGMNPPGMNPPGMNLQGMPPPGMPPPGMNPPGMNLPGMNPPGMNPPGMNLPGVNPPGMNPPGMNPPGMTPPGMPPNGMAPTGVNPIMFGYPQPQAQFHQGQFSLQMFQQNQAKNNDDEVQKQKQKEEIKKKNDEIQKLQNEVSQLKEEIEKLEYQFNKKSEEQEKESKLKFTNTKVKLNEDISSLKQQIYDQQRQIEQYEEKERQFVQIKKKHQNEISALMDEKIFLEQQLNSLDQSKAESSFQNKKQFEELQNLKSQVADYQKQIQKQDNQIQQQNQLMEILKQVKTQQSNDDSNSQNITKQLAEYKKKIEDLTQQNKQLENTYNHFLNEQKEYKANFEMIIIEKKMYMDRAQFFEQCTNELNAKLEQNLQRGQGDSKDDNKEYLKGFLQRQEEVKQKQQEQMMLAKERIQEQKIYDQQQQKTKNDLGKQKTKELVNKAGQIQCCFVMDLFKSTEKAGKAIIHQIIYSLYYFYQLSINYTGLNSFQIKRLSVKATETCRTSIKEITNRESSWGAVCYGYTKSGLQITKQQFTQTSHQLTSFLQNQKLQQDQKDQPEDLKSALETMLKLDWTEKYKLAIIIPNSPCHGKKYHHPKKYSKFFGLWSVAYDSKPNDDMENIIKEIVKRNIFMLVIRFNEDTQVMCSQLEQLYSKIQHSGLFHTLSVKRLDQNNSDYELVMKIIQMASFIIGTKNIATKTKINEQMRMQNFDQGINDMKKLKEEVIVINKELQNEFQKQGENKKGDLPEVSVQDAIEDQRQFEEAAQRAQDCTDSALQALCRRGDVANFQTKVQCEDFNCIAYSVELKQSSFEKKIENIEQIKYGANDFDLKEQAQWQCIRTKKPFAYGMMKEVYLMKKKNNTKEIYVVKIPIQCGAYKKLEDAVNDCRSHLIAKNMMKVFIEKIRSKNDNIMMVQYTDFLILQENQNKYWIAERFFEGEFKKYNNNDGYICEDNSELNAISQAFSYFTYQMSTFNYIINDIQGVQNFFTDPAINTTKGNFDETDVGEDGMSSYLSTFQMRKGISEQLLKSIDIEID